MSEPSNVLSAELKKLKQYIVTGKRMESDTSKSSARNAVAGSIKGSGRGNSDE